jgi:hypothetical protein
MAEDKPDQKSAKNPTKSELVARAIERGVPSYEAWAMTESELKRKVA